MPKPLNHYAWVVTPRGELLHCVPDLIDDRGIWHDDFIEEGSRQAQALCGRTAKFVASGVFSRMELQRCDKCCSAAGFPPGKGTPLNEAANKKNQTDI